MKLNLQNLNEIKSNTNIKVPNFDITKMREKTKQNPTWLHFGGGNIFRIFVAELQQQLLDKNLADTGIIVAEGFDTEIIKDVYDAFDNLTVGVTLQKNGDFDSTIIASVAEAISVSDENADQRLEEIITNPSLQMVSFTITEKGYAITTPNGELLTIVQNDIKAEPKLAKHIISKVCYLLYLRYKKNKAPIAMVSMDNCAKNGDKLKKAVIGVANEWIKNGFIEKEFLDYINNEKIVSFTWSMIDKITPRPSEEVGKHLEKQGLEDMKVIVTSKGSYTGAFVNAEKTQYLVIEDNFPNKRPLLENAGVLFTDRETVNKIETMKVTTCLNPLHTTLAVSGCILGYTSIAEEMKDEELVKLIKKIGYDEALKVVVDPKVINPKEFIDEVINERFPNPFIPDSPQRIATDTSQKVSVRFGQTIKKYYANNNIKDLKYIPLAIALWLRYLLAVDDNLNDFTRSNDPLLNDLDKYLDTIKVGEFKKTDGLIKLLKNKQIFDVDLEEVGLSNLIISYFEELCQGKDAVRNTLKKYLN